MLFTGGVAVDRGVCSIFNSGSGERASFKPFTAPSPAAVADGAIAGDSGNGDENDLEGIGVAVGISVGIPIGVDIDADRGVGVGVGDISRGVGVGLGIGLNVALGVGVGLGVVLGGVGLGRSVAVGVGDGIRAGLGVADSVGSSSASSACLLGTGVSTVALLDPGSDQPLTFSPLAKFACNRVFPCCLTTGPSNFPRTILPV